MENAVPKKGRDDKDCLHWNTHNIVDSFHMVIRRSVIVISPVESLIDVQGQTGNNLHHHGSEQARMYPGTGVA